MKANIFPFFLAIFSLEKLVFLAQRKIKVPQNFGQKKCAARVRVSVFSCFFEIYPNFTLKNDMKDGNLRENFEQLELKFFDKN